MGQRALARSSGIARHEPAKSKASIAPTVIDGLKGTKGKYIVNGSNKIIGRSSSVVNSKRARSRSVADDRRSSRVVRSKFDRSDGCSESAVILMGRNNKTSCLLYLSASPFCQTRKGLDAGSKTYCPRRLRKDIFRANEGV